MNAFTATIGYVLLIFGLFVLDRERKVRTSPALWLPIVWVSICASRSVSLWLGMAPSTDTPDQYLDGSPFDRALLTGMVALGLAVLLRRSQKVVAVLRRSGPIIVFLVYCGISIVWSDYPDVAFKRWVKAVGCIAMVLIVLTDKNPLVAVRRLLSRVSFVLLPMSVLLIKYYPDLGRGYNRFTYTPYYKGVSTGKNELGIVCLICGIGVVWRLVQMWGETRAKRKTGPLVGQLICLSMVFWLFAKADSMTSLSCFLMASVLLVFTSFRPFRRSQWMTHALVVMMLGIALSAVFLSGGSDMVKMIGRDSTLTGRTDIWNSVLAIPGSSWFGTGYESFWLGSRIEKLWSVYWWHPNEAHNGYIEVFLTLGWIGVVFLALILVAAYQKVFAAVRRVPEEGRLRLAFLFTALAYNCTESAFGAMHPIWIFLMLAAMTVPGGWSKIKTGEKKTAVPEILSPEKAVALEAW